MNEQDNVDRISEKVYHTDKYLKILTDVLEEIVMSTHGLTDQELDYDRNLFSRQVKSFQPTDNTYKEDINTLAILTTQLERFKHIRYNTLDEDEET